MLKKLPLGLNSFRTLRESDCLYVDKTEYAYNLITKGWRYFLSRPRRFGKSLFVSTLDEILRGNKELFTDLWIEKSDYQWKEHGVISLDLSGLGIDTKENLKTGLNHALITIAQEYDVSIDITNAEPSIMLSNLVMALRKKYGRVAILIDEYESPILHVLEDQKTAREIRDGLSLFFKTIKKLDAYINFVFLTGVTSFSKAGIFSGLNNLQVLTLDNDYGTILGYTDHEIDHYFKEYILLWAQKEHISYEELRQKIKTWYNGYRFGDKVSSVYNPFSLMNAVNKKEFKNFWFQSGAPKFLIDILKKNHTIFDPKKLEISEDSLGIFDVGATPIVTLMFQTGYLTIVSYNNESKLYKLDYPDEEVRVSFQKYLLETFAKLDLIESEQLAQSLRASLNNHDIEETVSLVQQLFAHIAYHIHAQEEKYYHALLQMIFIMAGIKSQSENPTAHGRIDLVLDTKKYIYIIEIKFNESAEKALTQIEERRYYEKYIHYNKPITLLGLSFNKKPKKFNITYATKELNNSKLMKD